MDYSKKKLTAVCANVCTTVGASVVFILALANAVRTAYAWVAPETDTNVQ